jgi:hypothetical protein
MTSPPVTVKAILKPLYQQRPQSNLAAAKFKILNSPLDFPLFGRGPGSDLGFFLCCGFFVSIAALHQSRARGRCAAKASERE